MRKCRTWHEVLIEQLADSTEAIGYLDVSLEEYQVGGDLPFFLKGIRNVVEAQGGVNDVAERIAMDPGMLSKILSNEKVLHLNTLVVVLRALGCRLSIQPLKDDENATIDSEPAAEAESTKFATILTALGCRLSIVPLETERPCTEMRDVDAPVGATESAATAMELATYNQ